MLRARFTMMSLTSSTLSAFHRMLFPLPSRQLPKPRTPQQALQQHLRVVVFQRPILPRHVLEEALRRRRVVQGWRLPKEVHLVTGADQKRAIRQPDRVADLIRDEPRRMRWLRIYRILDRGTHDPISTVQHLIQPGPSSKYVDRCWQSSSTWCRKPTASMDCESGVALQSRSLIESL